MLIRDAAKIQCWQLSSCLSQCWGNRHRRMFPSGWKASFCVGRRSFREKGTFNPGRLEDGLLRKTMSHPGVEVGKGSYRHMHNDFTLGYGSSLRPDWFPYCRVWSDWPQVGVRWSFLSCMFICDACQMRSASKAGTWPLFEVPSLPNGANNIPGSEGFPKGEIIISCVNTGIKDQVMPIILLCNYIAKICVLLGSWQVLLFSKENCCSWK